MNTETREHVRAIVLGAYEAALKEHTMSVFGTWMKDQSDQPKRALTGMQLGVSAYIRSRDAAKKWDPPLCEVRP